MGLSAPADILRRKAHVSLSPYEQSALLGTLRAPPVIVAQAKSLPAVSKSLAYRTLPAGRLVTLTLSQVGAWVEPWRKPIEPPGLRVSVVVSTNWPSM